ncbi:MAG: outer membrane beta-barrel protein [Saprospiraceae bacterium]|nr:outer membrane beta-barrel protein [Saprospiraceae bacterium]
MKSKIYFSKNVHLIGTLKHRVLNSVFLLFILIAGISVSSVAQEAQYTRPSWWFGAAAGANFNFYQGSTQKLNADFSAPVAFHEGNSVSLFAAPTIEFYMPGSGLGFMLQAGYDSRKGSFTQVITPCNCPADLSTDLSYLSIEPSIRWAPFKSNFYLFGGPRFAFNIAKSFNYSLGINPDYPEHEPTPDVNGDLSDINKTIISMQIGAGYDIHLSSLRNRTQFVLSPFVSYQPYFGQDPRSTETWNINTLRVGAAIKFGLGKLIPAPAEVLIQDSEVRFYVKAPKNIPVNRTVREIFPLRNYVFFDMGSTTISNRYELLSKEQVKAFKIDNLELFAPKNLSGRSKRQMIVYYNILNILGDRMEKNPTATINLVGSSDKGPKDGQLMAAAIENYLVDVFGINTTRINTIGQDKPNIPSEKPGATLDLELLREGDNRVSIESNSTELLMEFQNGPKAALKPIEIILTQEAPLDSYVSFNVDGGNNAFSSWSLEITDEKSIKQSYGPYYQEHISIPGNSILGNKPEGDYKVKMIGITKSGKTVQKETMVHMELWTPPKSAEGLRYSILYEFDDSKAIDIYEKYLTEVVVPKIPLDATVLIHGYTDIIGEEFHNLNLSLARANDVLKILENGLLKVNRKDVQFEIYGFGEDQNLSPFENNYPEERFYNRTVIIDIIAKK